MRSSILVVRAKLGMMTALMVRQTGQLTSYRRFQIHFVQIFVQLLVGEAIEATLVVNYSPGSNVGAISCLVNCWLIGYSTMGRLQLYHFQIRATLMEALFEQCF
jgi:hypothetical protein